MILISSTSMLAALALSLGTLAVVGLLVLGLALLVPAARVRLVRLRTRRSLLAALLLLVALPAAHLGWSLYQQAKEDEALRAVLNPRLEAPLLLGEISFPAGTQVRLQRAGPEEHWHTGEALPHGLQTLEQARFQFPVKIRGLDVERLDAPALLYFTRLRLSRDQRVESWPCAAGADVQFRREPVDRLNPSRWHFQSCTLQDGALLADVVWPSGSLVYRSENGWVVQTEGPAVAYRGLVLGGLRIALGEDVQVQHWDAELAGPAQLGEMHYAGGTQVWGFASGDLRLTPQSGGAWNAAGEALPDEHSVFQSADGTLLQISPNSEAGIIRWMRLVTP